METRGGSKNASVRKANGFLGINVTGIFNSPVLLTKVYYTDTQRGRESNVENHVNIVGCEEKGF